MVLNARTLIAAAMRCGLASCGFLAAPHLAAIDPTLGKAATLLSTILLALATWGLVMPVEALVTNTVARRLEHRVSRTLKRNGDDDEWRALWEHFDAGGGL